MEDITEVLERVKDGKPTRIRIQYIDEDSLKRTAGYLKWNGKYWDLSGNKVGITKMILEAGMPYGDTVYKLSDRDFYLPLLSSRYSCVSFIDDGEG